MKNALAFTMALCAFSVQAQFDGWTNDKGNGIVAFSAGADIGFDYLAGTDNSTGLSRTILSGSLFASYGILKHIDIGLQAPIVSISGTSNLQDGMVYGKYMFIQSSAWKAGILLSGMAPLSDYETDNGLATIGQQAEGFGIAAIAQREMNETTHLGASFQYNALNCPVPSNISARVWLAKINGNIFKQLDLEYRAAQGGRDYLGDGNLAPRTFQEIGGSYLRVTAKRYAQFTDRSGYAISVSGQAPLRNADLSGGIFFSYVYKL